MLTVVPVGFSLGPRYRPGASGNKAGDHWGMRLCDGTEELSPDEWRVWTTAASMRLRHRRDAITCETMLQDLVRGGAAAHAEATVAGLLDRGLLLEFGDDTLETAFRRVRLCPTAVGYGNTREEPDRYAIAHSGKGPLQVTAAVYAVWGFPQTPPASLWDVCVAVHQQRHRLLGPDAAKATAGDIASAVATALPTLIWKGCAVLDGAW